jgi:poly-gamma-glutamate synthesis protein (capsule biosynthesis protein)
MKAPIAKFGPVLRIHPKAVECLRAGSFDIVNLANNHIADHGSTALSQTLELLRSNDIRYVGAGSSFLDAEKPLQIKIREELIEFLAFAENEFNIAYGNIAGACPLDPVVNIRKIKEARERSDIVIVMVHGGNEFSPIPSPRIVKTYRAFVDAGASAVIATHPHVPQGYETYKNSMIFYSLGNLTFDKSTRKTSLWSKSYLAKINFQGGCLDEYETIPFAARVDTGSLTLLTGKELDKFTAYIEFLSGILKDAEKVTRLWKAWCAWKGPQWLRYLAISSPLSLAYVTISHRKVARKFFLINRDLITCEAHQDLLSTYLDAVRKGEIDAARSDIWMVKELQLGNIPK